MHSTLTWEAEDAGALHGAQAEVALVIGEVQMIVVATDMGDDATLRSAIGQHRSKPPGWAVFPGQCDRVKPSKKGGATSSGLAASAPSCSGGTSRTRPSGSLQIDAPGSL